jgi:DNA modification methylase
MDLKQGSMFQRDFPGDIVRVHVEAGFHFFCRVTIWKDPWLIARRTRMRSLMHKTIVTDSSNARIAGPDYVLVFKKGGANPEPIVHPYGLKKYAGANPIPAELLHFLSFKGDQRKNRLSHWIWRAYASPVWTDIRTGRLLPYLEARESEEEKHVCPLQIDVIERLLTLYSNPNDVVLTPFGGVGSEICTAMAFGRRAIATELKPSYYRQMLRNIAATKLDGEGDQEMLPIEFGAQELPDTDETPEPDDAEDDEAIREEAMDRDLAEIEL